MAVQFTGEVAYDKGAGKVRKSWIASYALPGKRYSTVSADSQVAALLILIEEMAKDLKDWRQ